MNCTPPSPFNMDPIITVFQQPDVQETLIDADLKRFSNLSSWILCDCSQAEQGEIFRNKRWQLVILQGCLRGKAIRTCGQNESNAVNHIRSLAVSSDKPLLEAASKMANLLPNAFYRNMAFSDISVSLTKNQSIERLAHIAMMENIDISVVAIARARLTDPAAIKDALNILKLSNDQNTGKMTLAKIAIIQAEKLEAHAVSEAKKILSELSLSDPIEAGCYRIAKTRVEKEEIRKARTADNSKSLLGHALELLNNNTAGYSASTVSSAIEEMALEQMADDTDSFEKTYEIISKTGVFNGYSRIYLELALAESKKMNNDSTQRAFKITEVILDDKLKAQALGGIAARRASYGDMYARADATRILDSILYNGDLKMKYMDSCIVELNLATTIESATIYRINQIVANQPDYLRSSVLTFVYEELLVRGEFQTALYLASTMIGETNTDSVIVNICTRLVADHNPYFLENALTLASYISDDRLYGSTLFNLASKCSINDLPAVSDLEDVATALHRLANRTFRANIKGLLPSSKIELQQFFKTLATAPYSLF